MASRSSIKAGSPSLAGSMNVDSRYCAGRLVGLHQCLPTLLWRPCGSWPSHSDMDTRALHDFDSRTTPLTSPPEWRSRNPYGRRAEGVTLPCQHSRKP
jgi:hypothetical protein